MHPFYANLGPDPGFERNSDQDQEQSFFNVKTVLFSNFLLTYPVHTLKSKNAFKNFVFLNMKKLDTESGQ